MENTRLPPDFKEFLRLLNESEVRYLLVGGYAVGYYGYPRATLDMDVWIATDDENARRMVEVMTRFGFDPGDVSPDVFMKRDGLVRLGVPPLRLEILMEISGVEFDSCFERAHDVEIDGALVRVIHLADLRANKAAAGRHKDLDDLERLPTIWPPLKS